MTPDMTDHDFPYATNTRAGSGISVLLHLAAAAILAGVSFFNLLVVPVWMIAAPVIMILGRGYVYSLLTNAVHEALRNAQSDAVLDCIQMEAVEKQEAEKRRTGLTPGFFKKAMTGDDGQ